MKNFKHTKKTCKIIEHQVLSKEAKRIGSHYMMDCKFCKTHNVVICRCGWEFGQHPEF